MFGKNFAGVALCLCCISPAHAALFAELPNRDALQRVETKLVVAGDGFWVQGVGSFGSVDLTRYSSAGPTGTSVPMDGRLENAQGTEDGGVVLSSPPLRPSIDGGCLVERRDAALAMRWRRLLAGECLAFPSGEWTWVRTEDGIARFDRDGAQIGGNLPNYGAFTTSLYSPGGGDIVLARSGDNNASIQVQRVRPDGSVAWTQVVAMSGYSAFQRLSGDADAILLIAQGQPTLIAMLSPATGAVRWQTTTTAFRTHGSTLGPTRAWIIVGTSNEYSVLGFARDTGQLRTLELPRGPYYEDSDVIGTADGGVIVTGKEPTDGRRAGATGTTLSPFAFGGSPHDTVRLADGTHRVVVENPGAAPELVAVDANGGLRRSPLSAAVVGFGFTSDPALSASGRVLVHATDPVDGARDTLLAPDGATLWSRPGALGAFATSATVDEELACSSAVSENFGAASVQRVVCRSQDGALRWQREFPRVADTSAPPIRLVGGSLLVPTIEFAQDRSTVRRYDRAGNETGSFQTAGIASAVDRSGRWLFLRGGNAYTVYDAAGQVVARVAGNADSAMFAGEGGAVATVTGSLLRRYDANGTLRSESTLAGGFSSSPRIIANESGTVSAVPVTTGSSPFTIVRYFDAATGSERWSRAVPYDSTPVAIDAANVLLERSTSAVATRTVLSLADGSIRLQQDVPCERCAASSAVFDAQGRVLTLVRPQALAPVRIYRDTLPESLRAIDARSIAGAWYSPHLPGDGLVAMRDPASGTLFAAWFTYGADELPGPANQRWFTLQGIPAPGATAQVDVFQTRSGRFDQPGGTFTSRAGTATLRLVGCDRLEVDYSFQVGNDVVTNRRTFERLTDPGHACQAQAPAPVGALDWRQSGAWFSPATSGQGVLFSIDPSGTAFGAWFTYDRDGAVDDFDAQQWFTLQSSGAVATGEPLMMSIYSTFDGRFDRRPGVATFRVGEATVRFTGCDRARVDYRFDSSTAAGAMSGATGSMALERIGACP